MASFRKRTRSPPARANQPPNSQLSTGPRSTAGLASQQPIIPGEDLAEFDALLHDLCAEHQPTSPTEELLVRDMAQSYWLQQRAVRLQNECFSPGGIGEKRLALFLRYGTTHERAFGKAFNTLLRMKKDHARPEFRFSSQEGPLQIGFVSQTAPHSSVDNGFVRQNATARAQNNKEQAG